MQKVVFITASSSGFGFEIALDLSKKGYSVILNGRDIDRLKSAKAKLHNQDLHHIFCCDLTTDEMPKELDDFFTKHKLLPNIIIHSLGGKVINDKHPININILNKTMDLNINSAILINNYFIPKFQANKYIQKIIHISSSASLTGNASPCYSMSKAAVNIYIKNCARYYALDNIMFCAIVPNIIMHENSDWKIKQENDPQYYKKRVDEVPLKKFATPEDLTPYISSLCEIDSMHATGSLIELQGGV
ncbi:SDR family oxidoreductase [Sulfurimonas sp.]|uniref:SDR family oxidoreductase n=1 Tax=Sulfurimonas sp. TaxID=2022749 RepID=UPI003569FDDD